MVTFQNIFYLFGFNLHKVHDINLEGHDQTTREKLFRGYTANLVFICLLYDAQSCVAGS